MHTIGSPALWAGFITFVLAMLALDLGVFHRKVHAVGFREAAIWSCVWVALSLLFNAGLFVFAGTVPGTAFLTGYLVEKSLSVDNIFVFVLVFSSMRIPREYQHKVLFWGILSALVLRALMIFAGVAMIERFQWLLYVFGAFLVFTGIKLFVEWMKGKEEYVEEQELKENAIIRLARRVLRTTRTLHGARFFTVENGRRLATPLFLTLLIVEVSDVIFALDSIPAIFGITRDPFIIFTSNIFAILGLRSLFFLLANLVDRFPYLKVGLSAVLVFVGLKMSLADLVHVPSGVSLVVILVLLGGSIGLSLWRTRGQGPLTTRPLGDADRERAGVR
jgi:tellurite resistance protein TerC